MGTWSTETFGNDTACDWVVEFLMNPSLEAVEKTLDAAITQPDYLDSDVACEALAACEVIARLKGNWGVRDTYSEELDKWAEQNQQSIHEELTRKGSKAMLRILNDGSELLELWVESGDHEEWISKLNDLHQRFKEKE